MKLQPAMLFGEHMVLQRNEIIPVWGKSVGGDTVTVTLGENTASAVAENGLWRVDMPAMEAQKNVKMTIESAITGEKISFTDVAVGEVWICGGQSNMEFLLKYDEKAEEMYADEADEDLRFFRYPKTNFAGCLELNSYPEDGFWRQWTSRSMREFFGAVPAYMGRQLRKALGVPVGMVGCNWGGATATTYTDIEMIKANPALKPIVDADEKGYDELNWRRYYEISEQGEPPEDPKQKA